MTKRLVTMCLLVFGLAFFLAFPVHAQSVTLVAEFDRGAIAEYQNNSNQTSNAVLLSSLNINSISISQAVTGGIWSSHNVTATINYSDGSTLVFPAVIAWVKNGGGGGSDWIGLTTATNQNDGYTVSSSSLRKTYILQFPQSTLRLATLLPNDLDGSQNAGSALNVLNTFFPGPGSSSLTFNSSNGFSYAENSGDLDVIGTVQTVNAAGPVAFSISAGNSNGWYEIGSSSGAISLTSFGVSSSIPNDFEVIPNSRTITVLASDGSSTVAQSVVLSESDVDEGAPTITSAASFTVDEGTTSVATLTADETVTWSISGGVDAGDLSIDATSGALTFKVAPDFEAPADDNGDNAYVIEVTATDGTGNSSVQTVTVNVSDVDELGKRIDEISSKLREGLKSYTMLGLSDMLSYSEGLMSDILSYNEGLMPEARHCSPADEAGDVTGFIVANEKTQEAALRFKQARNVCGQGLKVLLDAGVTFARFQGQSRARGFTSMRFEKELDHNNAVGLAVVGSKSSAVITGFDESSVSDFNGTIELYGRTRLVQNLTVAGFFGLGRTWYDFNLRESDGLNLSGNFVGTRLITGGMLRGELMVANRPLSVDASVSYASEYLGDATFDASLSTESVTDARIVLGRVSHTRISLPLTYSFFGPVRQEDSGIGLRGSFGLLCEQRILSTGLACGYNTSAKLTRQALSGGNAFIEIGMENAANIERINIGTGYEFEIESNSGLNVSINFITKQDMDRNINYNGLITLFVKR